MESEHVGVDQAVAKLRDHSTKEKHGTWTYMVTANKHAMKKVINEC